MQIPASGSAVDTYLNETQNQDLPAVPSPAKGLRSSRATPYWLLLPGMAWLTVFFLVPLFSLLSTSLQSPVSDNPDDGYYFAWDFANYSEALSRYGEQFLRSFVYAGTATLLALLIAYPLAYFIAFKSGKYKTLLLVLVVAPFFASFLIRTYAWKTILADEGFIVQTTERPGPPAAGPDPQHADRGGHGHHVQLPALHDPPAVRGAGQDRPASGSRRAPTSMRRPSRPSAR